MAKEVSSFLTSAQTLTAILHPEATYFADAVERCLNGKVE